MIKEIPMVAVRSILLCDNCQTEMEFDGIALTTFPEQYPYTCPKCGNRTKTIGRRYPNIDFKEAKP